LCATARAEDRRAVRAGALVLSAADLLPANQLRGPDYRIDDRVAVEDDRYLFTLLTSEGPVRAHGMGMLQVRLDEMQALEKARALDREPQEIEGVKDSIKQTGKGIKGLLTDPVDTIGNIPKGVGRKVKSIAKHDKGGGSTRREFAASIGADPETTNPPLKKILDKLALRRGIGKGAVAVGSFALTAGAANVAMVARGASAMRTTADMNEAVRSMPLYKINERIQDDLIGMKVPPPLAERFVEHEGITTVQRLLFVEQYRALGKVPGAPALVELAVEQPDQGASLAHIRIIELLVQLHAKRPLTRIARGAAPIVELADRSVFYVSPADYLTLSDGLRREIEWFREHYTQARLVFVTQGRVSPTARELLEASHIRVVANADVAAILASK
jgi:hypothetical protein